MAQKSLLEPETLKEWSIDVFNAIGDGLLIADKMGVIQYVNPEYLRIIGMKAEEVIGKPVAEVRPGAVLPSVIESGKPLSGVYRKVGTVEYVVDMAPIIVNGEIIGGVSIVKDITEVKALSEELKKAQSGLKNLQGTMKDIFRAHFTFDQLIGDSPNFKETVELAKKAAQSNSNIILTGESGTGKELLAQSIHNSSPRKDGYFVAVNCAAIPAVLLESEMFGYAEGAFTGSKKGGKIGLFQLADRGTLFLDEIGDMDLELQAKILRVLQEQKVRRIGELAEQKIDIRVIAATNQNVESMVNSGRFRQDLYYRLNVFSINLPPLRERKRDILLLAEFFAGQYDKNKTANVRFSEEVKAAFMDYDWPGNIRELKNAIEYACNMAAEDREIKLEHLPERIRKTIMGHKPAGCLEIGAPEDALEAKIKKYEQEVIKSVLQNYENSVEGKKKACRVLGISMATLYRKLSQ
ncbi:MAG: sigma 54-interacting transcriptional regulator [Peptococcaceae bacterium]|jgi:transcriptional regulator with PAS, ATPase and Fis domain|nr:sigma 54-interacting transcriptional regulator [Peptococcaceae bacterium]MDH7523924.1 sigma 54-interacting transcriptional regulator [Peptococcaceae bacterium]